MSNAIIEEKERVLIEAFRQGNLTDKARIMRPAMKVYDKLHPGYLEAENKKYINPAEESAEAEAMPTTESIINSSLVLEE